MEQGLREAGFDVYGKGTDLHGPARTVAASYRVHGEGRNLQEWSHALVLEPPQSPQRWEQLLGRMHRPGQNAPYVQYDICTHVQGMEQALEGARFLQEVQGQPQKLLEATWITTLEAPERAE
jgi:superfamily II DNA or RNA helicase